MASQRTHVGYEDGETDGRDWYPYGRLWRYVRGLYLSILWDHHLPVRISSVMKELQSLNDFNVRTIRYPVVINQPAQSGTYVARLSSCLSDDRVVDREWLRVSIPNKLLPCTSRESNPGPNDGGSHHFCYRYPAGGSSYSIRIVR